MFSWIYSSYVLNYGFKQNLLKIVVKYLSFLYIILVKYNLCLKKQNHIELAEIKFLPKSILVNPFENIKLVLIILIIM